MHHYCAYTQGDGGTKMKGGGGDQISNIVIETNKIPTIILTFIIIYNLTCICGLNYPNFGLKRIDT